MWPLPFGVSYNSYLVVGSARSAIIDGVEASHALQQIDEIKAILGERHPDYLVINHMEPDHSGAIYAADAQNQFAEFAIVENNTYESWQTGLYYTTSVQPAIAEGCTFVSLGGL